MTIKNEILDYNKHKDDIDRWVNVKGEIKYLEFIKMLKNNHIDCKWKTISDLYRYDKRLQINLFKYISFFEEYIRAKLWNSNKFKKYKDLNEKNMNELIVYLCRNKKLLQTNFNDINKEQLYNIKKIRNTISHNDIILKCHNGKKDYKHLIKDIYFALPQEYKENFKNDIIKCSDKLNINKIFVVDFT